MLGCMKSSYLLSCPFLVQTPVRGTREIGVDGQQGSTHAPLLHLSHVATKKPIAKANEKEKARAEVCVLSDFSASLERWSWGGEEPDLWVEDVSAACERRRSLLLEGVSVGHELFPLFSSLTPALPIHRPSSRAFVGLSQLQRPPLARLSTRPFSGLSAADPLARNPCLSSASSPPLRTLLAARPIPPTTGRASCVLPTNFFGQVEHFHPSIHPLSFLSRFPRLSSQGTGLNQPPVPCSVNPPVHNSSHISPPPPPRSLAMSSSCSTGGGPSYCGRPSPGTWDLTDELNAFERKDRRAHGIDEKASMIMKGRKESRKERKERAKTEEEMFDTDA